MQYFNELLIQYRRKGETKIRKVVPDNLVVVHPEPLDLGLHFTTKFQPAAPLWALEYVSKGHKRKDYERNFAKYESDLRIPYYLAFYPDDQELSLWRLNTRRRYASVPANAAGRHPLPELEMEVALLDGWVRFWFRGELVPLPGDLLRQRDAANVRAEAADRRAEIAEKRLAEMRAELEKLKAERKSG